MKITKVEITNFRSIRHAELNFDPRCLVLVGINEAGKSNILKALSTLKPDYPLTKRDMRVAASNEDKVTTSNIRFRFSLTEPEIYSLYKQVEGEIYFTNDVTIAVRGKKTFDVFDFVEARANGLFDVNIATQKKSANYWSIEDDWRIAPGWWKPSSECPPDFKLSNGTLLKPLKLILAVDFPDAPESYLEPATIKDLSNAVGNRVQQFISTNLPPVLFWQYDEKNLLPSSIAIDDFLSDPDICIPLKNMFSLADHPNAAKAIRNVDREERNDWENFFKRIARKTTDHFRSIWKDHKSVSFELRPDGSQLIPGVREDNVFNFSDRSDGFKRFVSFLLLVSSVVESGELTDCLLLVDEPDISLHPSGARHLRDELIKISEFNNVVYSTHSIYMIDSNAFERHLIVKKTNEITSVEVANDNNISKEEVLFRALGTSTFEVLKEKNIIFEGWKDKKLFEVALDKRGMSQIKSGFSDVATCHVRGVNQIRNIVPTLELAKRQCWIVSDGDSAAKAAQDEHKEARSHGVWLRYDDFGVAVPLNVTAEDFIKATAYEPIISALRASHEALGEVSFKNTEAKLKTLEAWLQPAFPDKKARQQEIGKIKDEVFDNLTPADIEASYLRILEELCAKLIPHD